MNTIDINPDLLSVLDNYYNTFEEANVEDIPIVNKHADFKRAVFSCSNQYLDIMLRENTGPPHMIKGMDLLSWENPTDEWKEIIEEVGKLKDIIGVSTNALFAYYPRGGFIGWHDNSDAPGYTILFTHSSDGNGFYRYREPKAPNRVVTINDKPGWTCKTGQYGPFNKSVFHCAKTANPRWSIAFLTRNEEEYKTAINNIITTK